MFLFTQIFPTKSYAEATVLSVGAYNASIDPIAAFKFWFISLTVVTDISLISIPFLSASFLSSWTCANEFASDELYITPNVFIFGTNVVNKFNCSSIETISEVPVTFVPELFQLSATPASIGSVTAVNTIGMSFVAL